MADNYIYPKKEDGKSVLKKIGVDLNSRNMDCQDFEYTTCEIEEIEKYIKLYETKDTTIGEKRVLVCYLLDSLNYYIADKGRPHILQNKAFKLLFLDKNIHKNELEYWSEISENPENDWWIAEYLVKWEKKFT